MQVSVVGLGERFENATIWRYNGAGTTFRSCGIEDDGDAPNRDAFADRLPLARRAVLTDCECFISRATIYSFMRGCGRVYRWTGKLTKT